MLAIIGLHVGFLTERIRPTSPRLIFLPNMPNQTQAALARNWAILIALILQIRGLAGRPVLGAARRRAQIFHLLRVAEGLARRWLILNAGCARSRTACRKAPNRATIPDASKTAPAEAPLLRLLEPDPVLRPDDFSEQPFGAVQPFEAALHGADLAAPAENGAGIARRSQALLDVMRRPHYHTARMARWLRRAAKTTQTAFGRFHPLRVGRPPGARRRDRSCEAQAALWWLDKLARDSLVPGWVP